MATKLTKPVKRKLFLLLDNRVEPRPKDEITVTIYPDGPCNALLGFRAKGSKKEHYIPLSEVYSCAVYATERKELKRKK